MTVKNTVESTAPKELNQNDAGKSKRLELISSVIGEVFGSVPHEIKPLAYEEDFPFPYNNFVYAVNISSEGPVAYNQAQRQPGTHPIPPRLSAFIIRLPNPISGYNDKIRVQNEVAALSIARNALQAKFPGLIPRVFGWGSARHGHGWILQEHTAGRPLLDDFHQMSDEDKAFMLRQMVLVLDPD